MRPFYRVGDTPRRLTVFAAACLLQAAVVFARPADAVGGDRFIVSVSSDNLLKLCSLDRPSGNVSVESEIKIDGSPGASCNNAARDRFYVTTMRPETIQVFALEGDDWSWLQTVPVETKASYLKVHRDGKHLLSTYYGTGHAAVHAIGQDGRISETPTDRIKTPERAHCITTDSSGRYAFIPHTRPNKISQYRFDATQGKLLSASVPFVQREDNSGPRHLWFHPQLPVAYGSDEQGSSITAYQWDAEKGTLNAIQTESTLPTEYQGGNSTSDIEVHPSGAFVYVANRGHDSITSYRIDGDTGRVELMGQTPTEGTPRSFNLSLDGRFLVAAGQRSGNLATYRVQPGGRLKPLSVAAIGAAPWWVQFVSGPEGDSPATTVDPSAAVSDTADRSLSLGQGTMAGEPTADSVLVQARLTAGTALNAQGDLPGASGTVCFEWARDRSFNPSEKTPFRAAERKRDFIVRERIDGLSPDTQYFYRAWYGGTEASARAGEIASFKTLPGIAGAREVRFIVGSCMNYNKFMHGRIANGKGPLTATAEDKRQGFPAFAVMSSLRPDFFVGTGDIVYYDNPYRPAETVEQLRLCWHEQFRFPRMIKFFRDVPTYWSKDDHDFRFNDSDNASTRLPLPLTGINLFFEQLPIADQDAAMPVTYRTIRVSNDLQIWLTEGRDYRSPNRSSDGPEKTLWGREQTRWLKETLKASDARWKLVISPTPMVGPDDARKKDNHVNLGGFRHEADSFFEWLGDNGIDNLMTICGDRHWQYHSIHPSGVEEFACGALNDENARLGVPPGSDAGTDPEGLIRQPYISPVPSGGFLQVTAGKVLTLDFYNDDGKRLYGVQR